MNSFLLCSGLCELLFMAVLFQVSLVVGNDELKVCNKQPLESNADALPADNRFEIDIDGLDDKYIPSQTYRVHLRSIDEQSTFIGFTIFIFGDEVRNEDNPRKPDYLNPGQLMSIPKQGGSSETDTTYKTECKNALFQSDIKPKTSVEANWRAPGKDQRCVTINAYVAVKPDVWYTNDGPLSKRVCEDTRKLDDMPPKEYPNCNVCEEARYELTFEGRWSFNTHPTMYPDAGAHFSDVVGASHGNSYNIFKTNSYASDGLRILAEQGNTTELEKEILRELGSNVRTLVKASGQSSPDMTTVASFRANRDQHYLSIVTAIVPSPDWFLGVSNMELCDETGWALKRVLNLYPMDAGTDSGVDFTSANEGTLPAQPIAQAVIQKGRRIPMKPFARLEVNLVRRYSNPKKCATEAPETEVSGEGTDGGKEEYGGSQEPPTEASSEATIDTQSSDERCQVTNWEDWEECDADCVDGKRSGYHTRFRYHIVDGVVIRNDNPESRGKQVSEYCLRHYPDVDFEKCEEDCVEDTTTAAFHGFTVRMPDPSRCGGRNTECAVPGTCDAVCRIRKKKSRAPSSVRTNTHLHCPSSPLCLAKFEREEAAAQRRIMFRDLKPGQGWGKK